MLNARRTIVNLALLLLLAHAGCINAATIATRTITTTSATIESAAKAGAAAHIVEVDMITEAARARRIDLGCGSSGESLPADCRVDDWHLVRDAAKAKLETAKDRYGKFKLAILSADTACVLAADALLAYMDNKGGVDLPSIVKALSKAYREVTALLREMGVGVPGG